MVEGRFFESIQTNILEVNNADTALLRYVIHLMVKEYGRVSEILKGEIICRISEILQVTHISKVLLIFSYAERKWVHLRTTSFFDIKKSQDIILYSTKNNFDNSLFCLLFDFIMTRSYLEIVMYVRTYRNNLQSFPILKFYLTPFK